MSRAVGENVGAVDPWNRAPSPGVGDDVDVEEAGHGLGSFGDGAADDGGVSFEEGADHEEENAHPQA